MAYAVLVSLEQTIDQILNHDQYSISPQEKWLVISLDKYVVSLISFLEDYPEKANNLEGQIRDVATAAEDIIEYFMLVQIPSCFGYEAVRKWTGEQARIKFGHKLNRVAKKMESIVYKVVKIKNSIIINEDQLTGSSSIASSSFGIGNIDMVGFDDNLMEIKSRLLGESHRLQFLSIVGMGGIGKTTLAKNAYDDQSIQEHFQIRSWVTVSQDYRAREILSSLLDSMKEFTPEGSVRSNEYKSIEAMKELVYKVLKGRRYVIVMDDMWSTKVLDDVRRLFPDDDNGSRIMLTTRLSDVASYADSSIPPYEMRLMDENQSWNLFRQKVFPHQDTAPLELEIIGKDIVRSCRGLPLAVVVIAGVLSTITNTPASWREISWNIVHLLASKDERLEKILSLSYYHLPHHLRPCLLYMGLFPEYYRIRASELIKLWIAEGFLKHPNESKSLEEGAEEYLEDLFRRNLILVTERKSNGKIKSCSIHDMVRDTCLRLLEKENNLRHVTTGKFLENKENQGGCVSMRSILQFHDLEDCFEQHKLLRVLHAPKFMHTFELPPWKILKLFHLRYISISCYMIPSAMTNFQNLQTLILNEVFDVELPSSLWKMQQLRHLVFRGRLPHPEEATSALGNLQTLKEVLDKENRAYLLERIPNLKKLGLSYGLYDSCGGSLLNKSLIYLRQLEKLKIRFEFVHDFLYAVFPSSLKKCTLHGCKLSRRFLKAIGSLPNLEVLKLMYCSLGLTSWVICSDEFPLLKVLLIQHLDVKDLTTEDSSSFPRLECIKLRRCNDLRNISDDIGEIPTLELIEVKYCGEAVYEWARRIEEEQQSYGNDTLQVRCIGQS